MPPDEEILRWSRMEETEEEYRTKFGHLWSARLHTEAWKRFADKHTRKR